MLPTPLVLADAGIVRVFHTCCDAEGRGRPAYVDLDIEDPTRVVAAAGEPLLDVGRPGAFDENGVVASSVVRAGDGRLLLYYVGFELGLVSRYRLLTGLAASDDDGASFQRLQETPVLERSDAELLFRCGPHVHRDAEGYRMWYVAGSDWTRVRGKEVPCYRIVHARSHDGIQWPTQGEPVVAPAGADEHGLGRPWVERDARGYRMYYSVRRISHAAYRLGCAHSADGVHWERHDAGLGLSPGPSAFDADAIMYAATVAIAGTTWCFYNGNDFGHDGIALASRACA
jgi:predicted GH43/DUF377 family glycosyl hydrolase